MPWRAASAERALARREQNPPATKRAPHAFTLLELLVSIAVIAILASLLLPALSRGRLPAQSAKCGGNLRQFVMAAQMYWDDNNGKTFPYVGATTTNGTYYWFGLLRRARRDARLRSHHRPVIFLPGPGRGFLPGLQLFLPPVQAQSHGADLRLRL